jgi:hypothetical protein
MRALLHEDTYFESLRKTPSQLDPDSQTDGLGEGAIYNLFQSNTRYGGREYNGNVVLVHGDIIRLDYVQLLQCKRVFGVLYMSQ